MSRRTTWAPFWIQRKLSFDQPSSPNPRRLTLSNSKPTWRATAWKRPGYRVFVIVIIARSKSLTNVLAVHTGLGQATIRPPSKGKLLHKQRRPRRRAPLPRRRTSPMVGKTCRDPICLASWRTRKTGFVMLALGSKNLASCTGPSSAMVHCVAPFDGLPSTRNRPRSGVT